jgi:short-subunit dehydrogenase involved in D-alanine esterification of teichoic acids
MRLEKVTALVTGASSGIGESVSSHFRREGARLLLTGRREQLATAQPEDLYLPGDLNDETFVASLAHRAAESFGSVDVVVLNHGLQVSSPLTEMVYDDARNVLHSNLLSAFLVLKHFAPLMPAAGGSFVCVGSRLGMVGKPEEVLYSAAKGGLIMLAKGAAINGLHATSASMWSLPELPPPRSSKRRSNAGPTPRPTAASARSRSRSTVWPPPTRSPTPSSSSHPRSPPTSPERSSPSTAGTPPSERRPTRRVRASAAAS